MTKSYTLAEIHQNRLRIKSIPKNFKFLEVYKICVSFGELMFFDVLACIRPLVYASFVNRKDAFAALEKINAETLMEASFSNESSNKYSNDEIFLLDLKFLDECEKQRLFKKKQIRVRSRKDRNFKTKQFEKNFDIYPDFYSTDSNSEVLVSDEEIKQLLKNEHKLVHRLSDWEYDDSSVATLSSQPSLTEFVRTNEEDDKEDEETPSNFSNLDVGESKMVQITHSLSDWEYDDSSVSSSSPQPSSKFVGTNEEIDKEDEETSNTFSNLDLSESNIIQITHSLSDWEFADSSIASSSSQPSLTEFVRTNEDDEDSKEDEKTGSKSVRITHSFSDWESTESLVVSSSSQPSSLEFVRTNEEYNEDDIDTPIDMSLTSLSAFNGKPKDWSKLRFPRSKCISDFFPSLKEKSL